GLADSYIPVSAKINTDLQFRLKLRTLTYMVYRYRGRNGRNCTLWRDPFARQSTLPRPLRFVVSVVTPLSCLPKANANSVSNLGQAMVLTVAVLPSRRYRSSGRRPCYEGQPLRYSPP